MGTAEQDHASWLPRLREQETGARAAVELRDGVHYLFVTRHRCRALPGFLPIRFEHPIKGAIVLREPQGQHLIGLLHLPPDP